MYGSLLIILNFFFWWKNADEHANTLRHLRNERAQLIYDLNEISNQLTQSRNSLWDLENASTAPMSVKSGLTSAEYNLFVADIRKSVNS